MKSLLILRKEKERVNTMKPTFKVAAWELKRNLKNKSFIISLFLTPLIFAFFIIVPSLFNSEDETETVTLFVQDEINVFDEFEATISETPQIHWNLTLSDLDEQAILKQIENEDNMAYIAFTRESL